MLARKQKVTKWYPSAKQIQIVDLLLNPDDRRTKTEKINEVGVSRKTFYSWMKDERFIEYMNSRLGVYTNSELADVWKALIQQCKRGNIQAIKLFFEMKEMHPSSKIW